MSIKFDPIRRFELWCVFLLQRFRAKIRKESSKIRKFSDCLSDAQNAYVDKENKEN